MAITGMETADILGNSFDTVKLHLNLSQFCKLCCQFGFYFVFFSVEQDIRCLGVVVGISHSVVFCQFESLFVPTLFFISHEMFNHEHLSGQL